MSAPFNRRPLQGQCFSAGQQPPQAIDARQQCAILPALRAAYYSLLAGKQTAEVRNGDMWQTFQRGNAKELKAEIRRLEILCENPRKRAVRAGPYVPSDALPGWGFPFGAGWPF